ncbi:MAG: TraB/GumN family protein [Paludibacteraceae bacterium]|nr:TraB/GumN family protein [Paludibacteraceae bacterium]
MKRICFLLIILFSHFSLLRSQLIYEISGNGAKDKSYLLATNRLVDIQFLDTIPNLFQYFGRCNKVINEFAMQDYEAIQALRQAALLPDSVILANFYTDTEYRDMDQSLKLTLKMGWDKLCRMKPSYLTEMYRTELFRQWLDFNEERSMEAFFEIVAQEKNMPIYGLDNVGETMYMLFDREPFFHQCKDLKHVIDYPEQEVRQERNLCAMYRNGLLNDIVYLVTGPDNTSSLSYSDYQVYAQRNLSWVKRLAPYLQEGKAFITLNCIYLGGEKGLLAQLRAAGYKVKPANKARTNK